MSTRRAFVAAALLGAVLGFGAIRASADQELLRVWLAPGITVQERAAAVNRSFTNGTPMSAIVAVLGTNYVVLRPFSSVWLGPTPEPRKTSGLIYRFGDESVTISTTAGITA